MAHIGFNPLMHRPSIMDVKYGYMNGAGQSHGSQVPPAKPGA